MAMAGNVGRHCESAAKSTVPRRAQVAPTRIGLLGPKRSRTWPESGAMQAPTTQPGSRIEPASVSPVPITSCE